MGLYVEGENFNHLNFYKYDNELIRFWPLE